jgi:hypothetical protein
LSGVFAAQWAMDDPMHLRVSVKSHSLLFCVPVNRAVSATQEQLCQLFR